jgi:sulfite exporter TauE/SafE
MDCCTVLDPASRPFDVAMLLVMGLTISLGHCVGMCGPLVTAFSVSSRARGIGNRALLARNVVYHLGRITSYGIIGALFGWLGESFFVAEGGRQVQGGLSLAIAVMMLLVAASLAGWVPALRWLESGRWGQAMGCRIRELLDAPSLGHCFLLGGANGWLPCGPVLAAAMTAAATGSPLKGIFAMLLFGAATIPVLVILGMGTGQLGVRARMFFHRIGAVVVVLIAVQLALRGLAAFGVVGHLKFGEFVIW